MYVLTFSHPTNPCMDCAVDQWGKLADPYKLESLAIDSPRSWQSIYVRASRRRVDDQDAQAR